MQNKLFFLLFSGISCICAAQQGIEIVVSIPTTAPLYKDCANMITLEVPSKGRDFQPICRAKGGEITQSVENPHKFLVNTKENQCDIVVADENNVIGSIGYKTAEAPKPSIQFFVDGQPYDGKSLVKATSKLSLQVIPDADFQKKYPNDAKYSINSVQVFAKCGGETRIIGGADLQERAATSPINLPIPSTEGNCIGKEITLIYEISAIFRKNFKGEIVKDERFSAGEKVFYVRLER